MLLPRLDFVFDDAVRILCKGSLPTSMSSQFWYELNEKGLARDHSKSITKRVDNQSRRWIEKHPDQALKHGDRVMVAKTLAVKKQIT